MNEQGGTFSCGELNSPLYFLKGWGVELCSLDQAAPPAWFESTTSRWKESTTSKYFIPGKPCKSQWVEHDNRGKTGLGAPIV